MILTENQMAVLGDIAKTLHQTLRGNMILGNYNAEIAAIVAVLRRAVEPQITEIRRLKGLLKDAGKEEA